MNTNTIETLYRDYSSVVTAYFTKQTHDPFVADDLTQHLFERLLTDKHKLEIENAKAFLIHCAKNILARYISGRREMDEIDDFYIDPKSENYPLDDKVDRQLFHGTLEPDAQIYYELRNGGITDRKIRQVLKLSQRKVSKFRDKIRQHADKYLGEAA